MRLFCALLLLIATGCVGSAAFSSIAARPASGVHPLFDLSSPERSPFPSDRFTVADDEQNTARRVNLRIREDCTVEVSECEDVAVSARIDVLQIDSVHCPKVVAGWGALTDGCGCAATMAANSTAAANARDANAPITIVTSFAPMAV
jgi:hypothetical protein